MCALRNFFFTRNKLSGDGFTTPLIRILCNVFFSFFEIVCEITFENYAKNVPQLI